MSKIERILLVDDDKLTNTFTQFMLIKYDADLQINTSLNGEEAKQYLHATDSLPDLIILDINMPLMNGLEFLEWQSQSSFQEIRVVMYSSSDREEDMQESLRYEQVIDYFEKPFDLQMVQALFHKLEG